MALSIRLARFGAKKKPFYRVVTADKRAPRDGAFIEKLGHYNPQTKDFTLDQARYDSWVNEGAKPSDTVARLVRQYRRTQASA